MPVALCCALALALTLVLAPLERGGMEPLRADRGDARYLAFADRMAPAVEDVWDERAGFYRSQRSEPQFNANLLLVFSVAAQAGHRGPARQDERARRIARRLVQSPAPFVVRDPPTHGDSQTHVPGWTNAIEGRGCSTSSSTPTSSTAWRRRTGRASRSGCPRRRRGGSPMRSIAPRPAGSGAGPRSG